jgi:hypothetical protein
LWSVLVAAARLPASDPVSWRYFDEAAALVFGASRVRGRTVGLRVYHLHPGFQFGPLSIVAAQALREVGGSHVLIVAHIALVAAGLAMLWLVDDAASRVPRREILVSRAAFLLAGATFLLEWNHLAIDTLHIDDAIALACAALAVDAIARNAAWWWPALAIGAATAAKPWAIAFLPLILLVPYGSRRAALILAVVVGLGVWAPFAIADSKTMLAAHYTTLNAPSSVLRLFGIRNPRTPRWDRLAQLSVALALGVVSLVRRRWEGIVLVTLAVRILLDPSVNTYYTSGLVFGALVWDLMRPRWRLPVTTISVALLLELPTLVSVPPTSAAILRLLAAGGAIVAVLAPRREEAAYAARAPGREVAAGSGGRRLTWSSR